MLKQRSSPGATHTRAFIFWHGTKKIFGLKKKKKNDFFSAKRRAQPYSAAFFSPTMRNAKKRYFRQACKPQFPAFFEVKKSTSILKGQKNALLIFRKNRWNPPTWYKIKFFRKKNHFLLGTGVVCTFAEGINFFSKHHPTRAHFLKTLFWPLFDGKRHIGVSCIVLVTCNVSFFQHLVSTVWN